MSKTIDAKDPAAAAPMTDAELLEAVGRLLALVEGLPTSAHRCGMCGRIYQLSCSHDLQATASDIARELHRRGAKVPPKVTSDWQARVVKLEVD